MKLSSKKVLFISNSTFFSGAEFSLFQFLANSEVKDKYILVIPKKSNNPTNVNSQIYQLPLYWICKTANPLKLIGYLYSLLVSTILFIRLVKKYQIEIVYANTIKSVVYGAILKVFTKCKLVWHVRDNIKPGLFTNYFISQCNSIICISQHIQNQFPQKLKNNWLVYSGINHDYWKLEKNINLERKFTDYDCIKNSSDSKTKTVAYIAQLTRWKNHKDFIKTAKIILERQPNICFLIIGDDLSGQEKKYKKELFRLVQEMGLSSDISFLGFKNDIKTLLHQIDVVVHPAINEPFGKIILEAMSMEKPVVAYNCGGPKEIINNGQTGFLVETLNYQELADKTLQLLINPDLCAEMGKAARKRVKDKFTIEKYVREVEGILYEA